MTIRTPMYIANHPRDSTYHFVALFAAIARKRACIDTCGENLPASSQNNAIFATFTRDSRKSLLERLS
jgi:hypothetical protein